MECTRWGRRHILVILWNKLVYHWKLDSHCVARVPETGQDILHYLLCLPGSYLIKRELISRKKHGLMIPVFHSTFIMIQDNSSNILLWKQCLSWKISQARLLFTHSSNFGISLHFPKLSIIKMPLSLWVYASNKLFQQVITATPELGRNKATSFHFWLSKPTKGPRSSSSSMQGQERMDVPAKVKEIILPLLAFKKID